jgi:hypothetical protein
MPIVKQLPQEREKVLDIQYPALHTSAQRVKSAAPLR